MYGGSIEAGGTQKGENGYKTDPDLFLFRNRSLSDCAGYAFEKPSTPEAWSGSGIYRVNEGPGLYFCLEEL